MESVGELGSLTPSLLPQRDSAITVLSPLSYDSSTQTRQGLDASSLCRVRRSRLHLLSRSIAQGTHICHRYEDPDWK